MTFFVDAHLPPAIAAALRAEGHEAAHTRELPTGNQTRDSAINELSFRDQEIVVTKDTDFFYSHVLHGRPWKLLLVRTGTIGTGELRQLFERHLPAIIAALQTHRLIEVDWQSVTPVEIQ